MWKKLGLRTGKNVEKAVDCVEKQLVYVQKLDYNTYVAIYISSI